MGNIERDLKGERSQKFFIDDDPQRWDSLIKKFEKIADNFKKAPYATVDEWDKTHKNLSNIKMLEKILMHLYCLLKPSIIDSDLCEPLILSEQFRYRRKLSGEGRELERLEISTQEWQQFCNKVELS